ncbi:terminase [Clostridia bacterium]|nr:terminase [Clostridia bacterium]
MRKYRIKPYQKEMLHLYLLPPLDVKVSSWTEDNRILDSKSSAVPGPWRNEMTPYLSDIMDEMINPETEEVIFVKPTQVGGTESIQNIIGYIVDQDPAPSMIVYPTDRLAARVSINRLEPMITASSCLRRKYRKQESSRLEKQFEGMSLTLAGANSPSSLSSSPIRYLFLDEVDKYPEASTKEADPVSLARERTKTFANRKIVLVSTPTINTGHIWKAKDGADIEKHYFVPCPHCEQYIELKFAQLRWPEKSSELSDADRAEFVSYKCQRCGGSITDNHKQEMLKRGDWRAIRENGRTKKVAYWMSTLYSPFVSFSEVALKFMASKDDPDLLHNFVNSWLAEPWQDTKLAVSTDLVMERQTKLPEFLLPDWTKLLTAGVDVQESGFYFTLRAWGSYLTSQNITHGQALTFDEIEKIMNLEYVKESGDKMLVDLCLVDSGNETDSVYDFCVANTEWALPAKGASATMLSHYKLSHVNKSGSKAFGMPLVLIDTGKYKDMIAARLRKKNGKGSFMVYKGTDADYADQLTSEQKVSEKKGGRDVVKWVKKSSHTDNHYLDCEVYAFAAADVLNVRNLFLQDEASEELPKQTVQAVPEEEWIKVNDSWI